MHAEFIEPTTSGRVRIVTIWVLAMLCSVAIDVFWPRLMQFVRALPLCEQVPWMRGLFLFLVAFVISIPVVLASHGRRILQFRQLPLPGTLVFRRTKVKRGSLVLLQAYVFFALAGLMILGLAYATFRGWSVVAMAFTYSPECNGA